MMKLEHLAEPRLEFANGLTHIDVRYGLANYGPVNRSSVGVVRIGLLGTNETVEGVSRWFEKCSGVIPAKNSKQPQLFVEFPGFRLDTAFRSRIECETHHCRTISQRRLDGLVTKAGGRKALIEAAVDMFVEEAGSLREAGPIDVLVIAPPVELLNAMDEAGKEEDEDSDVPDFHHLLKAKAQHLCPIQIILPSTYNDSKKRKRKSTGHVRKVQDEATRAWNIHTALYYKAGGIPWRLERDSRKLTVTYLGVSFYDTLDAKNIQTSTAQVFDELGQGVIVRGGTAKRCKEDRQVHLSSEEARKLVNDVLNRYRMMHHHLPARVVVHKTSTFDSAELDGFEQALNDLGIEYFDLISITNSYTRLFRNHNYPPLRGTLLHVAPRQSVLYTKGSVPYFETYPGMYVPLPLLIRAENTTETESAVCREIFELSKMNWNCTQFDGGLPITIHAARQVGKILKYVPDDARVEPRYSHYM